MVVGQLQTAHASVTCSLRFCLCPIAADRLILMLRSLVPRAECRERICFQPTPVHRRTNSNHVRQTGTIAASMNCRYIAISAAVLDTANTLSAASMSSPPAHPSQRGNRLNAPIILTILIAFAHKSHLPSVQNHKAFSRFSLNLLRIQPYSLSWLLLIRASHASYTVYLQTFKGSQTAIRPLRDLSLRNWRSPC